MSLNIVKRNSSSPFHLQRSMVDQGGEGGAYESGGYTGKSNYVDSGIGDAIASFGKVIGAGIQSRTASDKNDANVNKETRLEKRSTRIEGKKDKATTAGNTEKATRLGERNKRVEARKEKTTAEITKYNESQKPTVKSDIKVQDKKETKPVVEAAATVKINEDRKSTTTEDKTAELLKTGTITKSEEQKKKDRENEVKSITPLNQTKSNNMIQPKKSKSKNNPSIEGSDGSWMIGLPPGVEAANKRNLIKGAGGPHGDYVENKRPMGKPSKTPLHQKKKIVEKGSYDKGKVEKYVSKSAMAKHEKKETKSYEKKEGKKPSPTKMKKC